MEAVFSVMQFATKKLLGARRAKGVDHERTIRSRAA